jgi:hypothetical protein
MKKSGMFLLVMVLLVSPAFAQQAKRNAGPPQASSNVAKLLNAYNRMIRVSKQSGAAALSGQTKGPFVSVPNTNMAPGEIQAALPRGDRPFDADASGVNPFSPTASPPGSLSNLSPALGPGVDPFGPGQLTVNPFSPSSPSPATPFLANPADVSLSQGIISGSSVTPTPKAPVIRKTSQPKLQPLDGMVKQGSPLSSNPYSSLSGSDPLSPSRSSSTTDNMIPGSRFQPLASP